MTKANWGKFFVMLCLAVGMLAACQSLRGGEWILVSLNGHELIPETTITLSFTSEGLVGYGGCNQYGTAVEIKDDTFVLKEKHIATTEFYCVEPEGNVEQENEYITTLESIVTYSSSDGRLEMKNETGDVVLIFQK
jgi:heat shock protein HslJ